MRDFKVGQKYVVCGNHSENGNIIEITDKLNDKRFKYKIVKAVGNKKPIDCSFTKSSVFACYLKPLKPECIVIYCNGSETVALDKTTGKKAVAKCSQEDTYDFYTGAQLAFERLTGKAEPLAPEVTKPSLKPFLQFAGYNYGYIGKKTFLKDIVGRPLRIGDTVELYEKDNRYRGEHVVTFTEEEGKAFICGIAWSCEADGTIKDGWKVILKRKHEDITDGEIVDEIKYIKKEV